MIKEGRKIVKFSANIQLQQQQQLYASSITLTLSTSSSVEKVYDKGEENNEGEEFDDSMLDDNRMMKRAKVAFDKCDHENTDNTISVKLNDLSTYLENDAMTKEQRALSSYLDLNGDGDISLEEFLSLYCNAVKATIMQT